MTQLNPHRGEVGLKLDGKVYPMLPTWEAMVEIEERLGSIVALSARLINPLIRIPVSQAAIIAEACIKAAGRDRNDKMLQGVEAAHIGPKMYEADIVESMKAINEVVTNMLTGGTNQKKRDDVTEAPPTQ